MIKPGQSEKLVVYTNSTKYQGQFKKSIRVTTNDPSHAMETLTCTGKVLTPIKSTPQRLNLGNISPGAEDDIRKTIVLERGDGGDIHPVLLPSRRGRPLHVKTELREVEAGARYELDVTLAPPWPAGRFTDVLRIQTGIKESPELNYYVYGTVPPRLTTSPKYILVPPERTEEVTRTARIQWSNNKPAKILEVSTSVPGAKVEIEEDIHGQSVKLTVPAGSQPSAAQHNITIKTDDPNSPVIKLPVAFRGRHGLNRAAQRGVAPRAPELRRKPDSGTGQTEPTGKPGK